MVGGAQTRSETMSEMSATSEQFEARPTVIKDSGWMFVRLFVAAVLLIAAGLKAHQLATTPSLGDGILEARWFNAFVVEFELFFATWLVFGLLPKLTWLASVGLFSMFATVSAFKGITGEASCGCFGEVAINPWITSTFDVGVVALLVWVRPREVFRCENATEIVSMLRKPQVLGVIALWLCVAGPVTAWMMSFEKTVLAESGELIGNSKMIVLEPEKWIGQRFPLSSHLDSEVGGSAMSGNWDIILFHFDCEKCKHVIENVSQNERTVFLEIPTEESNQALFTLQKYVTLPRDHAWWVQTPIVISLKDGIVQNVSDSLN